MSVKVELVDTETGEVLGSSLDAPERERKDIRCQVLVEGKYITSRQLLSAIEFMRTAEIRNKSFGDAARFIEAVEKVLDGVTADVAYEESFRKESDK